MPWNENYWFVERPNLTLFYLTIYLHMKNFNLLFCGLLLLFSTAIFSQKTITGTVKDLTMGEPLIGVNVIVKGTAKGTETDFDGKYVLDNINPTDILVFQFIGSKTKEVTVNNQSVINVILEEDVETLQEIVVIGYGSVQKKDATGSVTSISAKDFNKTPVVGADQLIQGKVPGVRITNSGGQPDAAPNIRIRGGSSLSANNSPLIVIDGVPLDNINPAGVSNPLSLINPNDIENFSILKDASATAIYGSRASNGVIIITTKKGTSSGVKFNFSSNVSISNVSNRLDVMTGDEFTRFIKEYHPDHTNRLGIDDPSNTLVDDPNTPQIEGRLLYNTDWQDVIYRTSIATNNNFNVRANLFNKMPSRFSFGHTKNEGLVKTNDYERFTLGLRLTPKFINDRLKVDLNAKGVYVDKNPIDEEGVLGSVVNMDPTKPYLSTGSNKFGRYFQAEELDQEDILRVSGQSNPLAILEQRSRPEQVYKVIGNIEFDYTTSFLPELRAIVNLGIEASESTIKEEFSENAIATYNLNDETKEHIFNPGINYEEEQKITNTTLDAYLAYDTDFEDSFLRKISAQAGYSYQNFERDGTKKEFFYNDNGLREPLVNENNPTNRYFQPLNLQSFFGRTNLDFADKYLLTLSLRADGSSLFREGKRWGYFPAAALAWKVSNENFMSNQNVFNDLKLRLGWGQTGQQDITSEGYFPSTPLFTAGSSTSQYLPGYNLYSANPFNESLTWEKATTYNAGLDFSLFNYLLEGAFDMYYRETSDLLASTSVPPGQGLRDTFASNVGVTESRGFELSLNMTPIKTDDFNFTINSNLAYTKTTITDLKDVAVIIDNKDEKILPTGTGVKIIYHPVGFQANSAWVFQQLYDTNGDPIWGAFADLNGDNQITNEDRYYKPITPNWTYGFSLNFNYKQWDLGSNLRGQIGGYIYNTKRLTSGWTDNAIPLTSQSLNNVLDFYNGAADANFKTINGNVPFSDYYLEDATFLRVENIVLGYTFNQLAKNTTLRLYTSVANPFIITNYTGQDPENFNGIDKLFYPRPTTYTFGLNLDF